MEVGMGSVRETNRITTASWRTRKQVMTSRMNGNGIRISALVAAALALTGCQVGPDYSAPPQAAPDGWSEAMTEGVRSEGAELASWWTALDDPMLDSLVARAVKTNLD